MKCFVVQENLIFSPWGINLFSSCRSSQRYFVYNLVFIYEPRSFKLYRSWLLSLINIFYCCQNDSKNTLNAALTTVCLMLSIRVTHGAQVGQFCNATYYGAFWNVIMSREIYFRARWVAAVPCCTYILIFNHLLQWSCFFPLRKDWYIVYFSGTLPYGHP